MKNIFKIAAAALLVAGVFSCSNKVEYLHYAGGNGFVSMYTTDMNPLEDTVTLQVPVRFYAGKDVASTVSYKIVEGSARAGVDYEDSGDGTLAFAAGDTLKYINITIINHPGEFTGALTFSVDIVSATNNVNVGALNEVNVTIGDKDHPLTSLFGDYTMKGIFSYKNTNYYYSPWSMKISQYDGDPYKCWISSIVYYTSAYPEDFDGSFAVWAEVSEDMKTITIPVPQITESCCSYFGDTDPLGYFLYTGDKYGAYITKDEGKIVFTLQEDGVTYATTDAYALTTEYDIDTYGGYPYSSYFTVYSHFGANYPTYFVKK